MKYKKLPLKIDSEKLNKIDVKKRHYFMILYIRLKSQILKLRRTFNSLVYPYGYLTMNRNIYNH